MLGLAAVLGTLGVVASFGLFWYAERRLGLDPATVRTLLFLKLLVAGHMTLFLTRNTGWFWERPWPSWRLVAAIESTQVLGTLAAVYGWWVTPIGWPAALAVWGYAFAWFLVNNVAKVFAWRALCHESKFHGRFLERGRTRTTPHGGDD